MNTFSDKDLFGIDSPIDVSLPIRRMTRIFVFDDDGKIGLVESKWSPHWYDLPGGGCEDGESFEDCAIRECMEEIGVEIVAPREIAVCDRSSVQVNGLHLHIVFFVAQAIIKGTPTTTDPREQNRNIVWLSPDEVFTQMNEYIQNTEDISYQRSPKAIVYVLGLIQNSL